MSDKEVLPPGWRSKFDFPEKDGEYLVYIEDHVHTGYELAKFHRQDENTGHWLPAWGMKGWRPIPEWRPSLPAPEAGEPRQRLLTELTIVTHHPEHYLLVNENDGTRWRGTAGEARRGTWAAEPAPVQPKAEPMTVEQFLSNLPHHYSENARDEFGKGRLLFTFDEAKQAAEVHALYLLNTPEIEDFDKAVPLEAAHQVVRWGSEQDAGKNPEDWFWLIGYLAGKALAAFKAGDMDKAKHHCVSTAAATRNWHAAIRSGKSVMRPGISEEKQV